jgi:hypothetical protein
VSRCNNSVAHHLLPRPVGEQEDERREHGLAALQASYNSTGRSFASNRTMLIPWVCFHLYYKIRLRKVINGRECGIKEAAMRADWRKLFPTTACSLSQDALYRIPLSKLSQQCC